MTDETIIKDPIDPTPEGETEEPSIGGEEGTGPGKCAHCLRKEAQEEESNELNLAILIALVPALTITLFSNMGLF